MKLFSQAYSYEAVELKNGKVTESERKGKEKRETKREIFERKTVFINSEITIIINLSLVLCIYITQ